MKKPYRSAIESCIINDMNHVVRQMRKYVFTLVSAVLAISVVQAGQTYEELIVPPKDPEEAQRVRVWLDLRRQANCRVTVDVLDSRGRVLRHLMDRLMRAGYYNLYWDKRDDSGRYVPSGEYTVLINDCGNPTYTKVEAAYRPWEAESGLSVTGEPSKPKFEISLTQDSALVSLAVTTVKDDTVAVVLADSLMMAGTAEIPFAPDKRTSRGAYVVKLSINGGFVREQRFQYLP
ncbi:hypothetical protein GF420_12780 [candidate division GN15 bacterium]|nr:hypothetical protein [candidate division GN15 bacterium]